MTMKLTNGRNVTIHDKLVKAYKKCYKELPVSHIEFILAANEINQNTASEEEINQCIQITLKEEIQTAVDFTQTELRERALCIALSNETKK